MRHTAGHLAQRTKAFLLHNHLLGPAQFIVGFLHALGQSHPIIEAAVLFLGGKDFGLQCLFLGADGFNFCAHLFGVVTDLLHDQHNHADRDGGDRQLRRRDARRPLDRRARRVRRVEHDLQTPHLRIASDERHLLSHPEKAYTGKHAAEAD